MNQSEEEKYELTLQLQVLNENQQSLQVCTLNNNNNKGDSFAAHLFPYLFSLSLKLQLSSLQEQLKLAEFREESHQREVARDTFTPKAQRAHVQPLSIVVNHEYENDLPSPASTNSDMSSLNLFQLQAEIQRKDGEIMSLQNQISALQRAQSMSTRLFSSFLLPCVFHSAKV